MDRETEYLDSAGVRHRYKMKKTRFFDLRNNPDPQVRFPPPTIKQGVVPLWSLDDLDAYDERQKALARDAEARKFGGPPTLVKKPELVAAAPTPIRRPGPK